MEKEERTRKHHNGGSMVLADLIETILNHGAGPADIAYDDLRIILRVQRGLSLDTAGVFLAKHIDTALGILTERTWNGVKTTTEWDDFGHVVPDTEAEIRSCIAGIGRASAAVGLHVGSGEDDWLFVYARDHGAKVWLGKRQAEHRRLATEVVVGRLGPSGLAIAEQSVDKYDQRHADLLNVKPRSSRIDLRGRLGKKLMPGKP